ncbi:unnamed protein product [Absidia cylindrospora]
MGLNDTELGHEISMMDMDVPNGYVTRIRRMKRNAISNLCDTDYIPTIIPLIELAIIGQWIMTDTLNTIHRAPRFLEIGNLIEVLDILD